MGTYYLFQQNMHVFDGSNSELNKRFRNALQTISGNLSQGKVVAAGLTEIMNEKDTTVSELGKMVSLLDPKLASDGLFATGIKLIPQKTAEYISISVNAEFRLQARGRVMLVVQPNNKPIWMCVSDEEVPVGELSDNFVLDSRGLAYVCGEFGDQKMVAGFTHNISTTGYNDTYQLLADIMQLIRNKHSDYDGCPIIFGGDFPITPSPITDPVYTAYAVALPTAAEADSDDVPLKTSNSPAYDFWVADGEVTNNDASVYRETWSATLSDHAGIALRVNAEINFGA